MGTLGDKLRDAQTIGLDAASFIYHFEVHPRYKLWSNLSLTTTGAGVAQIPFMGYILSTRSGIIPIKPEMS